MKSTSIENDPEAVAAINKLRALGYSGEQAAAAMIELQKEPEPVVMYTGEELHNLLPKSVGRKELEHLRDLILARRSEMLRAMGSEGLVDAVVDETGLLVSDPSAENVITLITEHIEASRPELTDAVIEKIAYECWEEELDEKGRLMQLAKVIARRAAEYRSPIADALDDPRWIDPVTGSTYYFRMIDSKPRARRSTQDDFYDWEKGGKQYDALRAAISEWGNRQIQCANCAFYPAVAELRAENERLREMYVYLGCFPASTPDEFVESAKELAAERGAFVEKNMVLSHEIEAVKSELATAREAHGVSFALLRDDRDALGEECDRLKNTIGRMTLEQEEREKAGREAGITARWLHSQLRELSYGKLSESKLLEEIREKCLAPHPVDDSDEYGILVQDGCVALVRWFGKSVGWKYQESIKGKWLDESIDPARIFKVTSQPRGPLKVPGDGEIEAWAQRYALPEQTHVRAGCRTGAREAIDWIKKANEVKL